MTDCQALDGPRHPTLCASAAEVSLPVPYHPLEAAQSRLLSSLQHGVLAQQGPTSVGSETQPDGLPDATVPSTCQAISCSPSSEQRVRTQDLPFPP